MGIVSRCRDYTVSWSINRSLGIELGKMPDMELGLGTGKTFVSNFVFEDDFRRFTLLDNRILGSAGALRMLFAPSLWVFDFLLKIEECEDTLGLGMLFKGLREADKIASIVKLEVSKIKEKESFLF